MISNQLAAVIKRAAELRENSFDQKGADKAVQDKDVDRDFDEFYTLTLDEASALACHEFNEPQLASLIPPILRHLWSDALEWADEIIK